MEKIAIITVNYNNYPVTKEFIDGFKDQTNKSFHIYIVDLSDQRNSLRLPESADVIFSKNKGYAHGVNVGLKTAIANGFTQFVIINNDTEVSNNFVEAVLKSLSRNKSSIIGGKIFYYPGFEYHKDRYSKKDTGHVLWYAGGEIDWANMIVSHRGVDEVDDNQYNTESETKFVTGCLMCFDKKVLDTVGEWDESYFLYYEDTDWCERAKRRGIKLIYDPTIVIWHKNAQSTGGSGSSMHQRYQEKNRLRFAIKYAPLRTNLHLFKNLFFKR
jgi:GT2 family glycosyltransferase